MDALLKRIELTGQEIRDSLAKDPQRPSIVALRRLSHYCVKRILETDSKQERFICFSISNYIDSIFSNLGGDTAYDKELQKARISLIATIPGIFEKMLESLRSENYDATFSQLSDLIYDYAEKIIFLKNTKCA